MKFYIPQELTDPMVHAREIIVHGELKTIDVLAREVESTRVGWLNDHPGWTYAGTRIVKCSDGSHPPAYDVTIEFTRPQTPAERLAQDQARSDYIQQKEADFKRREQEQKALLEEILSGIGTPLPRNNAD